MNSTRHWFAVLSVSILMLVLLTPRSAQRVHAVTSVAVFEAHDSCATTSSPLFITWAPEEVTCPVCQTKNTFMVPMSWGSYIYQYPSKYQLIFWPHTDGTSWHSCKKCRYTAFMGDFKEVPKEKVAELRQMLEGVTLPAPKEVPAAEKSWHQPYMTIPSSARLVVAEKVYKTLGRSDDFWAHFYRVKASHFPRESKEADESRRQALKLVEGFIAKDPNSGRRKELLYISAAMHHFLKEDAEALKLFNEAQKLTYADPTLEKSKNEGYDDYISALIREYIEMLGKGEGPRDKPDH